MTVLMTTFSLVAGSQFRLVKFDRHEIPPDTVRSPDCCADLMC